MSTTHSATPATPSHGVERLLLTAEEVAEVLHIGRTRVYALMASRELTSVKIGALRRVPVDAVRGYAAALVAAELDAY